MMLMCINLLGYFSLIDIVIAGGYQSEDNTLYCDFTDVANSQRNFTYYHGGTGWITFASDDMETNIANDRYVTDKSICRGWANLSIDTDEIEINFGMWKTGGNGQELYMYIYSSSNISDGYLAKFKMTLDNSPDYWQLWDGNGVSIKTLSDPMGSQYLKLNYSFNTENGSSRLIMKSNAEAIYCDANYTCDWGGYLKKIYFYSTDVASASCWIALNEIRCNFGDVGDEWDIDKISYGDVGIDGFAEQHISMGTDDYLVVETRCDQSIYGNLNRVAIGLGLDSEVDLLDDVYLRVNGIGLDSYDQLITTDERYVYLWKDNDVDFTSMPYFEFVFASYTENEPELYILEFQDDVDNDNDEEYKYSSDLTYYNSEYDGVTTTSFDLVYQFWLDEETGVGEGEGISSIWEKTCIGMTGDYKQDLYTHNARYIEFTNGIKFDGCLKAFDLYISEDPSRQIQTAHMYQLYVSSIVDVYTNAVETKYYGNSDYVIDDAESGQSIVRWVFDEPLCLDNEMALFEVRCGDRWGQVRFGDRDGCGDQAFFNIHDTTNSYGDGLLSGNNIQTVGKKIKHCMYLDNSTFVDIVSDYPDVIITDGSNFYTYEPVNVKVLVSTFAYNNYFKIYKNDIDVTSDYIESSIFFLNPMEVKLVFTETGDYDLKVIRNSQHIVSVTINITDDPDFNNFYIYSKPNPSTGDYYIHYGFSHGDGKTGSVYRSRYDNVAMGSWIFNVSNNENSSRLITPYMVNGEVYQGDINYFLVVYSNGIYNVVDKCTHRQSFTDLRNYIYVEYEDFFLWDVIRINKVTYKHSLSSNVWIRVNDELIKDVSSVNSGEYDLEVFEAGNYVVELVLLTPNGTIVLDKTNFTATGEEILLEDDGILPTLEQPLGSIVGMIITLFCLLAPFMVAVGLKMKQNIHPVVFAFSGGLGIAISVVLGLFPSWLPFFLIAIGIIIIVITYLTKTNNGD